MWCRPVGPQADLQVRFTPEKGQPWARHDGHGAGNGRLRRHARAVPRRHHALAALRRNQRPDLAGPAGRRPYQGRPTRRTVLPNLPLPRRRHALHRGTPEQAAAEVAVWAADTFPKTGDGELWIVDEEYTGHTVLPL